MKVDKALANMMLSTLGQSMANISGVTNKECVVISLWSGAELSPAEKTAITAQVDANGLIPGNWTANFSGRTELARLVLTNFTNRFIGNNLDVDWAPSNRGEQFSFLNAGTAASFSMYVCSNSFANYASGAGNTGRMLLVGTVSDFTGNGDLKLNTQSITSQSKIRIPDIKMLFSYMNYVNTWTQGSGGSGGPVEDPFWSQTLFLAKFDGSGIEEISQTQMTTSGTVAFISTTGSATPGDQAISFAGNAWADFRSYDLSSHAPAAGDFTLEVMTLLGNTTGSKYLLADYDIGVTGGIRPNILIDNDGRKITYRHDTTSIMSTVVNSIVPGQLCHIAIQRRGTDMTMWVNGRRLVAVQNSQVILMSTLRVGVSTSAGSSYVGAVGCVRYTKAARYSGKGFYPSFQQFDRMVQAESELDHSTTVFEVDFGVSNKDRISDLTLEYGYTSGSPLVTYVDGEAVFNGTAALTTSKVGYGLGTVYTIEAYFTSTASHGTSGSIFGVGTSAGNSSYVYVNSNNLYFADAYPFVGTTSVSGLPANSADALQNIEYHVAMVFDGVNMSVFVNGRKVYTTPRVRGIAPADQQVWMGNQGGYGFTGRVRAMRVSNAALYTDDFIPAGNFRR